MTLQQIFTALLKRIGFPHANISNHWLELEKAYSKKSRYYHNLTHLEEMRACFEIHKSQLQFPDEVLYALFYHDIIYKSTRKDNELKSAAFTTALLSEHAAIDKQRVFDMIVATKDHAAATEDEKWLIDFDLRILAKEWEDYKTYYQQIRKEYAIYPDFLYHPGRKKALEHFLEKESIYQTQAFKTSYEAKARENLQKEISSL